MRIERRVQVRGPRQEWRDKGPDLHRTIPHAIAETTKVLSKRGGGPYWVRFRRPNADQYGRWSGPFGARRGVVAELERRLPGLPEFSLIQVGTGAGEEPKIRVVLRVQTWRVIALANSTKQNDLVVAATRSAFPSHRSLGWFNCRSWKTGGDPCEDPSQHAFGNGYDPGGSPALVVAMGDWHVRMTQSGDLLADEVIANRRKWTPSTGWRPYTGPNPHELHAHITARPFRNGKPACADCGR